MVVVECGWRALTSGEWRSKVSAKAVVGSTLAWMSEGVPFLFPESRELAEQHVGRFLYLVARREYRKLRAFEKSLEVPA